MEKAHQNFLENHYSKKLEHLHFEYSYKSVPRIFDENDWLMVHSEPETEVCELLAYAYEQAEMENQKPHFCVISPIKKLDISFAYTHFHLQEAYHYFEQAGRGYYGFDNQFLRAKLAFTQN